MTRLLDGTDRLYAEGSVARVEGRCLLALPNTTARSDRTLAFFHPERGLFVFSDRPLVRGGA